MRDLRRALKGDTYKCQDCSTPEQYGNNLDSLVQNLRRTGAKLIFATTTFISEGEAERFVGDDVKYNDVTKKVMKKYNIPIDDLHKVSIEIHAEHTMAEGNVHYTEIGYK